MEIYKRYGNKIQSKTINHRLIDSLDKITDWA